MNRGGVPAVSHSSLLVLLMRRGTPSFGQPVTDHRTRRLVSNFIVITSIFEPTEAVRQWAALDDWEVVVVGDRKTPSGWSCPGVTYLSPSDQTALPFEIAESLPWDHYSRKMLGYLYAMSEGAELIVDTDDDNIPLETWRTLPFEGEFATISKPGFANVYKSFSEAYVWPRGFPLRQVRNARTALPETLLPANVGIWQFLANGDPDIDAIHRLVFDEPLWFDERDPLVLAEGTVCPFNSQNTLFRSELFPLLYLPATVTFRFTDILRGLIAQPILWRSGFQLGFGPATVEQERNDHDYLRDFESEVPMYLHTEQTVELASAAAIEGASPSENLLRVYAALLEHEIVDEKELRLLQAWARDVAAATETAPAALRAA
jgi:hypothetical protein